MFYLLHPASDTVIVLSGLLFISLIIHHPTVHPSNKTMSMRHDWRMADPDFHTAPRKRLLFWDQHGSRRHVRFQKTDGKQTIDLPFMVVVYEGRHGADLDGVRVIGWIFKQAVVRVEELSGDEEEKLSGGSAVVQPAGRMNHESTTTESSAMETRDDTIIWWQRTSCDSFHHLGKHGVDAVNHL